MWVQRNKYCDRDSYRHKQNVMLSFKWISQGDTWSDDFSISSLAVA
jgi:hypothetical protein